MFPQLHRALAQKYGAKISRTTQGDSIFKSVIKGFVVEMPSAVAAAFAKDDAVAFIEEDAYVDTISSQPVARIPTLHTLLKSTQRDYVWDDVALQTLANSIRSRRFARTLNSGTTNGTGVYVYILDSGVERSHQEFYQGQVENGVQFSDSTSGPCQPYSPTGGVQTSELYSVMPHGTGVASVAGGQYVGMASGIHIVPVKVRSCVTESSQLSWWCLGIDWIGSQTTYPKQPAVVNVSMFYDAGLAPAGFADADPSSFESAITNTIISGIAVIVSANNQGPDYVRAADLIWTPACQPGVTCTPYQQAYWGGRSCYQSPTRLAQGSAFHGVGGNDYYRVISVGGLDESDRIWDCNNFGGECPPDYYPNNEEKRTDVGSNTGMCVDIYAPAHHIPTAAMRRPDSYRFPNTNSGTSFAAPYVAAIAARILQNAPWLTPADLWVEIRRRATALAADFDHDGISSNDIKAGLFPWE